MLSAKEQFVQAMQAHQALSELEQAFAKAQRSQQQQKQALTLSTEQVQLLYPALQQRLQEIQQELESFQVS